MSLTKTKEQLNQLIADLSAMSALVHQVHWYMSGAKFLVYHPLMDEWRDEIEEQLDVVAERLITLGGSPVSTLKEFAELTQIDQPKGNYDLSVADNFKMLLANYRKLNQQFLKTIEVAEAEGEHGVLDFMPGFVGDTEKRIWMLEAELR